MKTDELVIGMQVRHKRMLQSHGNVSEIRIGTVRAQRETAQGTLVKVSFPGMNQIAEVPVETLDPVARVLNRARVQFNPVNRQVQYLR